MSLNIRSWAFALEELPVKYSADGDGISPPLEWTPGPKGTTSYALIMDDPDGPRGIWVHWLAWNIRDTKVHEGIDVKPRVETACGVVSQGRNSFDRTGYTGPCPPSGTHRYFIKVYALDAELDLPPETTREELVEAMEGHVLDQGEMMVTYSQARARAAGRRPRRIFRYVPWCPRGPKSDEAPPMAAA